MPLNLKKVRRFIEAAGGVTTVAQIMDIPQGNLSRIVAGHGNPTIATIDRLAKAVKRKPRDLIE